MNKKKKVIKKKKETVKEVIKKILPIEQGSKLLMIAVQKNTVSEMINSFQMNLNALYAKEKIILEAFDLPKDIEFDQKTFEVEYEKPKE